MLLGKSSRDSSVILSLSSAWSSRMALDSSWFCSVLALSKNMLVGGSTVPNCSYVWTNVWMCAFIFLPCMFPGRLLIPWSPVECKWGQVHELWLGTGIVLNCIETEFADQMWHFFYLHEMQWSHYYLLWTITNYKLGGISTSERIC